MKKNIILLSSLLLVNSAWAEFDFTECSGSGTFEQNILQNDSISVGTIPIDIEGLSIELQSNKDVDIQLFDTDNNKAIVAWSSGNSLDALFYRSYEETKTYKDMEITYSGYNGTNGNKGYEFIKVQGKETPVNLEMKAYGYKAGTATVNYSWTGKVGCEDGIGEGNFTQNIPHKSIALVGEIPKNIDNLNIVLNSMVDVDVQLYGEDGTAIVKWAASSQDKGLLSGSSKQSVNYKGMHIEWSGYNGVDGQKGNEYIKVTPQTTEKLTMKVFGYRSGQADVTYSWGNKVVTLDRTLMNTGLTQESAEESICGASIDWQNVEQYDGTLGVTTYYVNSHEGSVGELAYTNSEGTVSLCSGTLLRDNTFLTAGHCILRDAQDRIDNEEMIVRFNYQYDTDGVLHRPDAYKVSSIIERENGGLDYAILQLSNNPTSVYAPATISENISDNELLTIIQHPSGLPKVLETGNYNGPVSSNYIQYTDLDTARGSSGAGVLNTYGQLVAVHTNGGCNTQGGANHGIAISRIKEESPFIRNLLNTAEADYTIYMESNQTNFYQLSANAETTVTIHEINNHQGTKPLEVYVYKSTLNPIVSFDTTMNNNSLWEMTKGDGKYIFRYTGNFPAYGIKSFTYKTNYSFPNYTRGSFPLHATISGTSDIIHTNNGSTEQIFYDVIDIHKIPNYGITLQLTNSILTPQNNNFTLTTRAAEYNSGINTGPLKFSIDKDPKVKLNFDQNYTDVNINNKDWSFTENDHAYTITYIGNEGRFPKRSYSTFQLSGQFSAIIPDDQMSHTFEIKELAGSGDPHLNTDSETAMYSFN